MPMVDCATTGDLITILLPTFNRYRYLTRLLIYYRICGSPFPMHILDSSSDPLNQGELCGLLRSPNVSYCKYDSTVRPIAKLYDGLKRVTTPYTVFWADDDFMVPGGVLSAATFLEENKDFSVAHGSSGLFSLGGTEDGKVDIQVWPYIERSYCEEVSSVRLMEYAMNGCSLFYSVHRTGNLRRNLEQCLEYDFGYYWAELTLAWLSVVQGKVKKVSKLYMMREAHDLIYTWNDGRRQDYFDWLTNGSFSSKYEAFRECVCNELAEQDKIDREQARELVKKAFWFYLAKGSVRQWDNSYASNGAIGNFRAWARQLPGAKRIWRFVRYLSSWRQNEEISLPSLLRSSSPYHADFMPIYRAITASPDLMDDSTASG